MRKVLLLLMLLWGYVNILAQDKLNVKFGKITPADFAITSPLIDSNVNAVVLSDIGSSEFEGNSKGWFSLVFKRHRRIKILNNKGFDAAETILYLYSNGTETEKLNDLAANTYNLENGEVVTAKLDSKSVFEERLSKNRVRKKFTFPSVKPGAIIEYTYTIKSDFIFNLQPWEFQGEYPCLWSEYNVSIPDFFNYVSLSQGYLPFDISKNENRFTTFTVRSNSNSASSEDRVYRINTTLHDRHWVVKEAPAIREENFTSTLSNHISKIEFQLSEYRFPNEPIQEIMGSWQKVSEKLSEREDFGLAYTSTNGWISTELKTILKESKNDIAKAKAIFEYLRDNFTCTSTYGIYLSDNTSLKDVFKRKSGSVSEINLLMLAMLRSAEIPSEPVLMSLRSRGFVHSIYPLMDRFNYLICQVTIDGVTYNLDGSRKLLGFNKLSEACYNGTAWTLAKPNPYPMDFSADSLREKKLTSIIIINDEKERISGAFSSTLGGIESYDFRLKMSKSSKDGVLKEITKNFISGAKIENFEIDSLNIYEEPISLKYDFSIKPDEDIIYFSPMLGEEMKQNPFKSSKRVYPVEMSHTTNEMYVLNMDIPTGYRVEESPKSVRIMLNEDEGMFEYLCVADSKKIQLRSIIKINKAYFSQDDYDTLRDFFSFIIKKQNEQIVFTKIK